jgi:hypothetical protein
LPSILKVTLTAVERLGYEHISRRER